MKRGQGGSMLVLALWTLSLLVIFSLSLGFAVRQKATLLTRLTTLDALYLIAYSGVEEAKSLVKSDTNVDMDTFGDPWAFGSHGDELNGGSFSILTDGSFPIVDEERKVNLNTTSVEIGSRLLQSVSGLGKEEAEELMYNLLDYRDSDPFFGHPQYGAEDSYYQSLPKPYDSKDAPYEMLDELLRVKGMTPEILARIRPYITVYGSGKVNINTASRPVLEALGFSAAGVDQILKYRTGADGQDGTADDLFFSSPESIVSTVQNSTGKVMDISQTVRLDGLVAAGQIGVSSTVFSVTSRAGLPNGASLEIDAVFNRQSQVFYSRAGEVHWPTRS